MPIKVHAPERKPHPLNTRAYHQHLEAVKHATREQLRREVAAKVKP